MLTFARRSRIGIVAEVVLIATATVTAILIGAENGRQIEEMTVITVEDLEIHVIEKGAGRATGIMRDLGPRVAGEIAVVTVTETIGGDRIPATADAASAKAPLIPMLAAVVLIVEVERLPSRTVRKPAPIR